MYYATVWWGLLCWLFSVITRKQCFKARGLLFSIFLICHQFYFHIWAMAWDFQHCKTSDQPAHTCSLIRAFASRLNILWLLSYWLNSIWSFSAWKEAAQARLSTFVEMPQCWKSHVRLVNSGCSEELSW